MWDNPPLLRSLANLLFGISLMLVLYGTVRYVLRSPLFPLKVVELTCAPQRVPSELLAKVVLEQVRGNFFNVDLEHTRELFEKLPWVRKVSVRRKFPWGLQVEVEEQIALAHWNSKALVNTHGEIFTAQTSQELPVFIGQPDTSLQMMQMYVELKALLRPMQQQITQISLSPRFAWQIKLDSGLILELGREYVQQRLARFVTVYLYSLVASSQSVRYVDLRYRNGFAAYLQGREV
jgi:cell division protein FtsQ